MDLFALFESLVVPTELPTGRSLSAVEIPGWTSHRLAKDSAGSLCLLVRERTSARSAAPIRLQNLVVSYRVPCAISHRDGTQEEGVFTIIKCTSSDPSLFPHFLRVLSPVIETLGATPTAAALRRAISGLVDLFQALTAPAKKAVQGLWAELFVIRCASDPGALVGAWHNNPSELVDFVSSRQRIEVKSSSNRRRVHHFSLVQLMPPANSRLLVASVFVEPIGGGVSLRALSDNIRRVLASKPALLTHFDDVFYSTLGASWSDVMEDCFDLELARESLEFFDSVNLPKIDATGVPRTVSDVRFTSDISGAPALTSATLGGAGPLFAAAIPGQRELF